MTAWDSENVFQPGFLEMESLFPKAQLEITAANSDIREMIDKLSLGNHTSRRAIMAQWNYNEVGEML